MSSGSSSQHCVRCERHLHWIEILVRDENNQPFNNIKGKLYESNSYMPIDITIGEEPVLLKSLTSGPVVIVLDYESWLNDAQQRTPFKGDVSDSPVQSWVKDNPLGYLNSPRKLVDITIGDLTSKPIQSPFLHDENENKIFSDLSARQKSGQLGELKLITDKSYVLRVRGSNYLTLRFGMFFDGTGNNTYSSAWGLQEYEKYYSKWKGIYDTDCSILAKNKSTTTKNIKTKDLSDDCFKLPLQDFYDKAAVCNEPTNVQKLHDLYCSPDNHTNYNQDENKIEHAIYVTGVGTESCDTIKSVEESNWGAGLGFNKYGVNEKTERGAELLVRFIINDLKVFIKKLNVSDIDGISRFEFDVFGFSRGAAVGRNFINLILRNREIEIFDGKTVWSKVREELKNLEYSLPSFFDFNKNKSCEIMFAGLYDTVASVANLFCGDFSNHNDYNPLVKLWLDPSRVRNLVHLTADPSIEVRWNFCLNKINKAENFKEYTLFGAHSDIGGGYIASPTLKEEDYYLPMYENKIIHQIKFTDTKAIFSSPKYKNSIYKDIDDLPDDILNKYRKDIKKYIDRECKSGWKKDDYVIHLNCSVSPYPSSMKEYIYTISIQRPVLVNGLLPRLYLRLMFGLAQYYGVPMSDKDGTVWTNKNRYNLYYVPDNYKHPDLPELESLPFGNICHNVLEEAKNGKLYSVLKENKFLEDLKLHNLIHHSAAEGLVNEPTYDEDKERYYRACFSCKEGQ